MLLSAHYCPSRGAPRRTVLGSLSKAPRSPSSALLASCGPSSLCLPLSRQLSVLFAVWSILFSLLQYGPVLGVAEESPLHPSVSNPASPSTPEVSPASKSSPVLSRVAGRREALRRTLDFDEFTVDDAEEVRLLLLHAKEYPVKYSLSTMLHFHGMPLFQQLSVVAREKSNEATRQKGKIVGVAGTALDNRGMANVMMLAVDDQHRRLGLGRELLRMSLEKASLFAPGSKANPNSGYEIERAVLHVWISQRPPLSLYMSTGFTPVRLIPDYYTAQDVQGGYEMQLSLPYMPVEDKLRAALAKQKKVLDHWAEKVDRLSHSPGAGAAKAAESLPPLRILPLTGASNEQRLQLMSFLDQGEVDEVTQAAMQVLGHPQLRKFALYGINPATGKALGAIWVPSVPQNGVLADPRVIVNRDIAHNDVALYLFEALLLEASRPEHGIHQVKDRVPAEDLSDLIHHWELGFRLSNFFEVTDPDSSPENDSFFGWSARERLFEHEMTISLPWERPEEFSLIREIRWNKSRLAFLKEFVKDLQRNPPPPPVDPPPVPSTEVLRAGAGAESSPVSSAPHSPAGNLSEGSEPLRSRLPVSSPAQPDEPVQESGTREPEGPSDPRSSVAEPSETSKKETMNAEAEKETDSADGVAGFIESYAVVFLAIGGLLLSVLLLRRFCVKTPEGAVNDAGGWRTSPVEESSGGKREGEGVRDGMVGPNKRPHAKKEGYSQVVVNAGQEQYSDDESGF